jgi:hypothetical protein
LDPTLKDGDRGPVTFFGGLQRRCRQRRSSEPILFGHTQGCGCQQAFPKLQVSDLLHPLDSLGGISRSPFPKALDQQLISFFTDSKL